LGVKLIDYIVGIGSGNRLYFSVITHSAHANQYNRVDSILSLLREKQMGNSLGNILEYRAQEPHTPMEEPPPPNMPPTPWRRGPTRKKRMPVVPPVDDPRPDEPPREPPRKPPRRRVLEYN